MDMEGGHTESVSHIRLYSVQMLRCEINYNRSSAAISAAIAIATPFSDISQLTVCYNCSMIAKSLIVIVHASHVHPNQDQD
jgi:hypothetical protein